MLFSRTRRRGGSDGCTRSNEDVQGVVMPKTQLVARHPNYAWATRLDHLDRGSIVEAQLIKPMYLVGIAHDVADFSHLPGRQTTEGN